MRARKVRTHDNWRALHALLLVLACLLAAPLQAQITFVGTGTRAVATSGTIAPSLPGGTTAGDLAILIVAGRPSDTTEPAAPSGWTLRTSVYETVNANDLKIMTFFRLLAGGDANPVVTLPAAWAGGMSGQIAVWRGIDGATPFDAADATDTSNPSATFTVPSITTGTAGALVVSAVATSDDNSLGLSSAAGFTARMSGAAYSTTTGADHSVGVADFVQPAAGAVSMPTWQQSSNSPDRWAVITFALRSLAASATTRLSMSFEESSWNGTAGEVKDDSAYGLNGVAVGGATTANATPASATNPGTCRYGTYSGSGQYVQIADNPALNITTQLTVSAWIYLKSTPSELQTIVSKDTNYEFHIDNGRHVYWWWNDNNGNVRSITTTNTISLNAWHHIAVTYQSGAQRIYIDGTVQGTTGNYTGTLAQNTLPLYIGEDYNFLSRVFDGYIDEVRVIARTLSGAEITALKNETHPCASTAKFTINHNGFGINCVAETITVNVVDSVAGTPLVNYNSQVQLDTQSGFGTWALVTGSGTFSDGAPNDGVATYTWPLGQSSATFTLYYPQGPPSIDVDVFQVSNTGIRDTDAEGPLVFSPNGFTVTAAPLSNPPPSAITTFATNQTAGTDFLLYLTAYGQTPTDSSCGVIEAYTGTKSVKFWSTYANPATGTRNVTINTVGAATSEGASVAQNVTFTNGQAVVTAKYKDVGRIAIGMKDDTTTNAELPAGVRGATANFVVRPYDFVLTNIQNAAGTVANPAAAGATDPVFIAAGAPFRATVTVRDAEGSATPNYGKESPAESVRLVPTLFAPAGGVNPAVGSTTGFASWTNGVSTGTDFTWAEVGIFTARGGIADADYLGAGDVLGPTVSARIGRFIPSRFVAALNSPLLVTQCTAGQFTYQGQPFGYSTAPVITATAVAVGGTTTANYTGAFFKLTNSSLTGRSYTSAGGGTLDLAGVPATTTDPTIASPSGGVATLTFSAGTGLNFTKTLLAPFSAGIQLAINVMDSDGVAAAGAAPLGNPVTFGTSGGIPFTAGQEIRYGRVRVGTAIGSERVDLPVPMRAEYYASAAAGFVTNTADTCTTNVSLAFSSYTDGLAAGETCVLDSGSPGASALGCAAAAPAAQRYREPPTVAAGGDFNLTLKAPGIANQGSVVITATVPAWLRYDWNSSAPDDENPSGQATFGIYGGETRQIYTREIY